MPPTLGLPSICQRMLSLSAFLNPWNWIAAIYAMQTIGALIVVHLFGLSLAEVALPILFLILGACTAVVLRWYDSSYHAGLWKWWIPVIIYALVIFFLSNKSYPEARPLFSTKLFHPVEYMTLGIFLSGGWHNILKQKGTLDFMLLVQISGMVFALSDEFHQAFIAGRTSSLTDVLIDSVGVALGLGAFLLAGTVGRALERGHTVPPTLPR